MRALGSMETALHLTDLFSPLNLVSVARLSDGPSPAALRQALDSLQARRPELRARIAERGGHFYFEPAEDAPIPLQSVTPQDDSAWQAAAEAELNTRLPLTYNGKIQHMQLRQDYLSGELARRGAILYPDL